MLRARSAARRRALFFFLFFFLSFRRVLSCHCSKDVVLLVVTFTVFGFLELLLSCKLQKMTATGYRLWGDLMRERKTPTGSTVFTAGRETPVLRLTPRSAEDHRDYRYYVGLSTKQVCDLSRGAILFPFLEVGPRCSRGFWILLGNC